MASVRPGQYGQRRLRSVIGGNRFQTILLRSRPQKARRPHIRRCQPFVRPVRRHQVVCDSRANLRKVLIGLPFAAAVQCRHLDQGCRSAAHRCSINPFAAVLRATVRPGETRTAKMDSCCPIVEACSIGPLKHSAVVVGRNLNSVAESESARLHANDGLFWGHPQLRRWPSRLS